MADRREFQHLLSLPPQMAAAFAALEDKAPPEWFAASDPPGQKLGSGGGTAHLLDAAWRQTAGDRPFFDWLNRSRKLIIHGGGESRRLPAYAATGKILMPVPVFRWSIGQRLDQSLLDLQAPDYRRVLDRAGESTVAMVASGDVLLRLGPDLPPLPDADIVILGMWVTPEVARHFGVLFVPREDPAQLAFFLQKPPAARIRELSTGYLYLVDSGMWLLSERAVRVLMERSGWSREAGCFTAGGATPYDLYGGMGPGIGQHPAVPDPALQGLTCAVAPLPGAEFYHLGASRQMIETVSAVQNRVLDQTRLGPVGARPHPDQFISSSRFEAPLRREENHTLWVENSVVPSSWRLAHSHVITGVPDNAWGLALEPGVCMDFAPIDGHRWCIRAYGIDDPFRGAIGDVTTTWLGRPAPEWFSARGITREVVPPEIDIQQAPLFPVLRLEEIDGPLIEWLSAVRPAGNPEPLNRWLSADRLSAQQIMDRVNLPRLYRQRCENLTAALGPLMNNHQWSIFYRLDLQATARLFAAGDAPLPPPLEPEPGDPMKAIHDRMFRAAVLRTRNGPDWETWEDAAFSLLRETLVREAQVSPALPRCSVLPDQIVWGRSPVRLDLAGGWSDTPPYCLEHGGAVVNVAVDLNGQPPLQVYARLSEGLELVMRSIDLGVEQRVRSYDELDTFAQPGSEFALAKAALALAGFLPRFHARDGYSSLRQQLEEFGGGIEVSLLSAVPKGSGLGTSSIMAATLLATIGDLCGLGWDRAVLFTRTLALEQMLTTGGGWQDQAGGIYPGLKLIETEPGLSQRPTLRWLPETLLGPEYANQTVLLYYTGITRLARNILQEIVRGMFLNSATHLRLVGEIAANAQVTFQALQTLDPDAFARSIGASWRLNQELDQGTNPPPIAAILSRVEEHLLGAKLLGAGGGGYLLMIARDLTAASRIRQILTDSPPNDRARFVSFSVSSSGLQVTRS